MSLKSNIEKVLKEIKGKKATIPINSAYDSRARFMNNAKTTTHGIAQRSSRGRYNYQTRREGDDRPSIVMKLPYELKYMQRKRSNSVALRRDLEVKYIDDNTLLMKVTSDFFNMQDGPSPGRWNYDDSDATHSVTNNDSIKNTEEIYLISADETMSITTEDNILVIGAAGDHTKTKTGDKITFRDSDGLNLLCIELKGANAKLWDEASAEKVQHILSPETATYNSPSFEEKPRKGLLKSARMGTSLDIAELVLHKVSDEVKLSNVTGKLTTALDISSLIISCNLCKGAVLTYTESSGETVSRDIEAGTYTILLHKMNSKSLNLSKYRKKVLQIAERVTLDFTVNRLDFLSALDLEKDEIRIDSNLEGRVDSGASIAIDSDVESVDTDKMVGRVSIINLDED